MAAAATPTIPENDPNNLVENLNQQTCRHSAGGHYNNCYNIIWKSNDREGVVKGLMLGIGNFGDRNSYGDVSHYTYASVAVAYRPGGFSGKQFWFQTMHKWITLCSILKRLARGIFLGSIWLIATISMLQPLMSSVM